MLSTQNRIRLEEICNNIAEHKEVTLKDLIWVKNISMADRSASVALKQAKIRAQNHRFPKKFKVIDYFTYYNSKELLELRIKLLYDYVDQFVIVEGNYSHSGQPKPFYCNQHIDELKLNRDKIRVIEMDLSPEIVGEPSRFDLDMNPNVKVGSRERIQRDCIYSFLDEFDDNCVFIVSDCDEMINPLNVNFLCGIVHKHGDFVKIPLVYLQGRADYRVYVSNTDTPYPWTGTYICLKNHLMEVSATHMKASYNLPFEIRYPAENGEALKDLGWHFSWMGKNYDRLDKAKMICHHDQFIDSLLYKTYFDNQMVDFLESYQFFEGNTAPSGHADMMLRKYPLENLPQLIFDLPEVKNYLLPE